MWGDVCCEGVIWSCYLERGELSICIFHKMLVFVCVQSEIWLPTPLCSLSFKGSKVCWTPELVGRVTYILVELPWSIIWVNAVQNVAPFIATFEMLEVDGGKDALISLCGAVDLLQSGASTWRGLPKMPSLDLTASTWTCVQWFKIWQSSTLKNS